MSNVVSISCTCDYLVRRAARHRHAGRYDEAMALLWKAHNQFGLHEEIQLEMARIYEEIGCETEAVRAYLRIVRLKGKHTALALFQLALFSMQHGDVRRAQSYFDRFRQIDAQSEISEEMIELLERQLLTDNGSKARRSRKLRARLHEKHAAVSLQSGRVIAAKRAIERALHLKPTVHRYAMLACCHLICMDFDAAVDAAKLAHQLSPGNVQALCVLCDAYAAAGDHKQAERMLWVAALRAKETDDLLSVVVESAKLGNDALTLRLTQKILGKAPFQTRAMMLRACALINTGNTEEAERILGRLCGLLPEDSVCESYYKVLRDGQAFEERLILGMDVTRNEGINRVSEIFSAVIRDQNESDDHVQSAARLCRISEWALHSPMAGSSSKTAAVVLLSSMAEEQAECILLDALTDSALSDSQKLTILQVLTGKNGFRPYDADIGGSLVRLAAGGVSSQPVRSGEANSRIVQRVADRLISCDSDAPKKILSVFLCYLDAYGKPEREHEGACAAALECWYRMDAGMNASQAEIARSWDVSERQLRLFLRRIQTCVQKSE